MNKGVMLREERDIPLLLFLWKWKLATTYALTLKFFPGKEIHTGYKRLLRLAEGKFVESVSDLTGSSFTWTLAKKGFEAIRSKLPVLREEGFKSENSSHDLLVSAIHLGDYLVQKPDSLALISEQELRRVALDSYPEWVPNSSLHRPDGYYGIKTQDGQIKIIALEVESSLKRRSDYEMVAEFYSAQNQIAQVLWVVSKWGVAQKLSQIFQAHSKENTHSFLLVSDFVTSGSNAEIKLGYRQGETMKNCLGNWPGSLPESVPIHPMLNTRKSPHRSKTWQVPSNLEMNDRLRLAPTQKIATLQSSFGGIHESLDNHG